MISTETVLITGAGASASYGYPLGAALLNELRQLDSPNSTIGTRVLETTKYTPEELAILAQRLRATPVTSIDQFLTLPANRDGRMQSCAKYCIAVAIFGRETFLTRKTRSRDWYSYLWGRLTEGIFDFLSINKNRLNIVTFNYDRSLEQYLIERVQDWSSGAAVHEKTAHAFRNTQVLHLYTGQSSETLFRSAYGRTVTYGNAIEHESFETFASEIHTIHEAVDANSYAIREARQVLMNARRIVFLGFGFDKFNVDFLRNHLFDDRDIMAEKQFVSTAFGLTRATIYDAKFRLFGEAAPRVNMHIGGWRHDCLRVLEDSGVLLEFFDPAVTRLAAI